MTDDLKEIATELSKRKYRALIPDLYKGKVGVEVEEAKHVCIAEMCFLCSCITCLYVQPLGIMMPSNTILMAMLPWC